MTDWKYEAMRCFFGPMPGQINECPHCNGTGGQCAYPLLCDVHGKCRTDFDADVAGARKGEEG